MFYEGTTGDRQVVEDGPVGWVQRTSVEVLVGRESGRRTGGLTSPTGSHETRSTSV